jgi:hypothetical protein
MAVDAYLSDSRMRNGSMKLGLTFEMDPYEHYLSTNYIWDGWDWKSYWLSTFATFKIDTFDDGYFPTSGLRFLVDGRYVFKGYTIDLDPYLPRHDEDLPLTEDGSVPRYLSALASFSAALSIGNQFTILPSISFGWSSVDPGYQNPKHIISVGGFMANRYTERQVPFFGIPGGYIELRPWNMVAQLDLRYCFSHKNFVTLRTGSICDDYAFKEFINQTPVWAFGAEYGRETMVGPMRIAAQWSRISGFTGYASIGFDF